MADEDGATGEIVPVSQCPICSALGQVETSLSKYGWEEMDHSLPKEAYRLLNPRDGEEWPESGTTVACPVCGTCYTYTCESEYLVNGSEDSETLRRLTPTEFMERLPEGEYRRRIEAAVKDLEDPRENVREYAARCCVLHQIGCGKLAPIAQFLSYPDRAVAAGALSCLRDFLAANPRSGALADLAGDLARAEFGGMPGLSALRDRILELIADPRRTPKEKEASEPAP